MLRIQYNSFIDKIPHSKNQYTFIYFYIMVSVNIEFPPEISPVSFHAKFFLFSISFSTN